MGIGSFLCRHHRLPRRRRAPPDCSGASIRLFECCLHGGRRALLHERIDRPCLRLARLPLLIIVVIPEHVLEAVCDSEAPVLGTLRHDALGPEMHGEVCPVVLAGAERVPSRFQLLLPRLVMRHEPPERSEVDDHAVVEVRVPEGGDALHLVEEGPQLIDEGFLRLDGFALRGDGIRPGLGAQRLELALLVRELGCHKIVLGAVQCVLCEAVNVEPDRISGRWRRELPVDRRCSSQSGKAAHMR